jgi:hypothetical protein
MAVIGGSLGSRPHDFPDPKEFSPAPDFDALLARRFLLPLLLSLFLPTRLAAARDL